MPDTSSLHRNMSSGGLDDSSEVLHWLKSKSALVQWLSLLLSLSLLFCFCLLLNLKKKHVYICF